MQTPTQPAKRKATKIEEIDSDDNRLCQIDQSCDQIRRKIRTLINSGEMKVTEFQKALGVSSQSYGSFMGMNGPGKGSGNSTYHEGFKFFKRRELQGIKAPKKRVKKGEEEAKNDVSSIRLEGEGEGNVLVYDTCDEIRRKISAYLREPGVTQAGFLREIAKTYNDGRKIQTKVLNDFLGKRGASAGNTSAVFYASYVFFEKLRLRNGKPKSKHRQDMEKEHPHGFDTKRRHDYVTCIVGETPYEDKYSKLHISGRF